jgi:hypothetical protein
MLFLDDFPMALGKLVEKLALAGIVHIVGFSIHV